MQERGSGESPRTMRHERWVVIIHPLDPSTGGQWLPTMRHGHWWWSYILWAPRLEVLRQIKGNLPEQSVILSKPCESKDLRTYVPAYGQIGAKIPRLGFAYSEE